MGGVARTTLVWVVLAVGSAMADDAPAPTPTAAPTLPAALRGFDRVADSLLGGEGALEQWWGGQYLTGNWFGWREKFSDGGRASCILDQAVRESSCNLRRQRCFHFCEARLVIDAECFGTLLEVSSQLACDCIVNRDRNLETG